MILKVKKRISNHNSNAGFEVFYNLYDDQIEQYDRVSGADTDNNDDVTSRCSSVTLIPSIYQCGHDGGDDYC